MSTSEFSVYGQMAVLWAPRVLAALVILLVAYLAGRALKWALASGINRIPVIARQNAAASSSSRFGKERDRAVTATTRSPSSSCATRRRNVESTPEENATAALPISRSCARSLSSFTSASARSC